MGCEPSRFMAHALRNVSIHTPAWGVNRVTGEVDVTDGGFNPHTRMGCERWIHKVSYHRHVSIHTPAWGVKTWN